MQNKFRFIVVLKGCMSKLDISQKLRGDIKIFDL
jgi:hypothetical protein